MWPIRYVWSEWLRRVYTSLAEPHLELFNPPYGSTAHRLPDWIGELIRLETLGLRGHYKLKSLPPSIGQLVNLTTLCLDQCSTLTNLPDTIGNLSALVLLSLYCCRRLTALPDSINGLYSLQRMHLGNCDMLSMLPDTMHGLRSLVYIDMNQCCAITKLPYPIPNIQKIVISGGIFWGNVKRIPPTIGRLVPLDHLSIVYGCNWIPSTLGLLCNLTRLEIVKCEISQVPDEVGQLVNLRILQIIDCDNLTRLPDSVDRLTKLARLTVGYCIQLRELPNLTNLVGGELRKVKLVHLPQLKWPRLAVISRGHAAVLTCLRNHPYVVAILALRLKPGIPPELWACIIEDYFPLHLYT